MRNFTSVLAFMSLAVPLAWTGCTRSSEISVPVGIPDNPAAPLLLKQFKDKVEKRDDISIVLRSAEVAGEKNTLSLWTERDWKKISLADRKEGFSKLCRLWAGLHPVTRSIEYQVKLFESLKENLEDGAARADLQVAECTEKSSWFKESAANP